MADASPMVRVGLAAVIQEGGLEVVGEAGDAREVLEVARSRRPDAVVLSAQIPGGVIQTVEDLRAELPDAEIVLLAEKADEDLMLRAVMAGARGFLLGEMDPRRLPNALLGVLDGEAAFPRRLVRAMADELARRARHRGLVGPGGQQLTRREVDVLDALATGLTTSAVGRRLGISDATVRRHSATAARKLGASSRDEALRILRGGSA